MISPSQKKLTAALLCLSLLLIPRHAKAQISNGQVVGIFVAVGAVGVGIGVAVALAVRHHPSVTGCTAANGDSLTLATNDHQTYVLSGDISTIKRGNRVHVSGKKSKDASGNQIFIVEKVGKDYGSCPVTAMAPLGAHGNSSAEIANRATSP